MSLPILQIQNGQYRRFLVTCQPRYEPSFSPVYVTDIMEILSALAIARFAWPLPRSLSTAVLVS